MLIDTDVWVWYLRGNKRAAAEIKAAHPRRLSGISYLELLQGVRDSRELTMMRNSFAELEVKIVYLDETVSAKAVMLMEQYRLGHSMDMGDALLGATALAHSWTLLAGNEKHYRMIPGLKLRRFRPVG